MKKPKLEAFRDFLVVRPGLETVSPGGILIPANAQDEENPRNGIVVSVGDGVIEGGVIIPLKVKVGDKIYFPRNSGTLIKDIDGGPYFILRENQAMFRVIE